MTPKGKKNREQTVIPDAAEMKSVLMEQPDFLVPLVQEAVQAILEVGMESVCRPASTSATTNGWASGAGITGGG